MTDFTNLEHDLEQAIQKAKTHRWKFVSYDLHICLDPFPMDAILRYPDQTTYYGKVVHVHVRYKDEYVLAVYPAEKIDIQALAAGIRQRFAKHDWMTEGF